MPALPKFEPKRYLVCLLLVLIATLITLTIRPYFGGKAPLIAFLMAVVLSAGYSGMLAGFFATAVCLAMILGFLRHDIVVVLAQSGITLFTVAAMAISFVMGRLHRSNEVLA